MAEPVAEIEGTWDEILQHADEFTGRRLKVLVLDAAEPVPDTRVQGLSDRQRRMLQWLDEWERTPLTDEERQVLDEFESFRKEHPFRLRRLDLEEPK